MNITVNSTTVSTLATLFITILTGLEGFNWVSLMSPEMALQVVSYIGLAKLVLWGWNTYSTQKTTQLSTADTAALITRLDSLMREEMAKTTTTAPKE